MPSLQKKIKEKDFGVLDVSKSIRVNRRVVYLNEVLEELGKVAQQIREMSYPTNMGEWIRDNSDAKTIGQLLERFVKNKVLGLLVEKVEGEQ